MCWKAAGWLAYSVEGGNELLLLAKGWVGWGARGKNL